MSKKVFVPIFEQLKPDGPLVVSPGPDMKPTGNEFFIAHQDFVGKDREEAQKIDLGASLVEGVILGFGYTGEVREIDPANIPHVRAKMGNMHICLISGPLFDKWKGSAWTSYPSAMWAETAKSILSKSERPKRKVSSMPQCKIEQERDQYKAEAERLKSLTGRVPALEQQLEHKEIQIQQLIGLIIAWDQMPMRPATMEYLTSEPPLDHAEVQALVNQVTQWAEREGLVPKIDWENLKPFDQRVDGCSCHMPMCICPF